MRFRIGQRVTTKIESIPAVPPGIVVDVLGEQITVEYRLDDGDLARSMFPAHALVSLEN